MHCFQPTQRTDIIREQITNCKVSVVRIGEVVRIREVLRNILYYDQPNPKNSVRIRKVSVMKG